MKEYLKNNKRTIETLNEMILSNHYRGVIDSSNFVFKRNYFPNNFIIKGTLKKNNFFEIDFSYQKPLDTLSKIVFILAIFSIPFFIIYNHWTLFSLAILIIVLKLVYFKIKGIKELKIFIDNFINFSEKSD